MGYSSRVALFYAAIFVVLGVSLPYLPLWLSWRGLSPYEIGIVTAVPLFIRIVATPAIGVVADRSNGLSSVVMLASWLALLSAALLLLAAGFWPLLILFALFQVSSMAMMPLAEVFAMRGVRALGLDYGRMRLWGSASFIFANLSGGWLLGIWGSGAILPYVILACGCVVGAANLLPATPKPVSEPERQQRSASMQSALTDAIQLLRRRDLLVVMVAAGLIQASHAVYYAFSAIHWKAQGISEEWFGVLWGIGVVAEIVLFAKAGPVLARIGRYNMIALGGLAGLLRWGAMAFDPPFLALVFLQGLHGLSFGATHLGAVHAIQACVGEEQAASAQTLHSALSAGVIMGCSTLLAGWLYASYGGAAYLTMALAACTGALLIAFGAGGSRNNAQ